MKRSITLVLFALFVIGKSCLAQQMLTAGQTLRAKVNMKQVNKSLRAVEATAPNYWVSALSSYDANGYFTPTGYKENYTVGITFNGNEVTIDNLVPLSEYIQTISVQPVKGIYNADAHTITVKTQPFDNEEDNSDCTLLAKVKYQGNDCNVILVCGNFEDEPDLQGNYSMRQLEELVFDVTDDLSVITPRSGYGNYVYSVFQGKATGLGFFSYYKSSLMEKIVNTPTLDCAPDDIVFEGLNVVQGASLTATLQLSNKGLDATTIEAVSSSDDIIVDYDTKLEGLGSQTVMLYFTPERVGEYNETVTFRTTNGSEASVTVRANVKEAPDFSAIVTGGDMVFYCEGGFPFVIDNDIAGHPVAASTNTSENGESTLNIVFTVPEGQTGVISWKGQSAASYSMGSRIFVDGTIIYDDIYTYMQSWEQVDIANTIVLGSGHHTLTFSYYQYAAWRLQYAQFPMQLYIYDLNLTTMPTAENAALLKQENVDFGNHYFDKLSIGDQTTVELINAGTVPLSVGDIKGGDIFGGKVGNETAERGKSLFVPITFNGTGVGEFEGDVTICTSAGDFTVHCKASAEQLPYDYSPIVIGGDFSFNTSFEHPFTLKGTKAISSIAGLEINNRTLDSWLEVSFDIPEGQTGTFSWTGYNSSVGFWYFMNDKIFEDGTEITIDGKHMQQYAGEMNASSSTFADELLQFAPGRHIVKFNYHKVGSEPAGYDRFELSNLKLQLSSATAIKGQAIDTTSDVQLFNATGIQMKQMGHGLNIVRQQHPDGTTTVRKIMVK